MFNLNHSSWAGLVAMALALPLFAQEAEDAGGKLTYVQSVPREDLQAINHVVVSADGKFVYTTSWQAMSLNVFSRDDKTGRVEFVQTVTSPRDLSGVTSIALSPDERLAAASAFSSQTATLFARDKESGRLQLLDSARNEEKGVKGLVWAIDVAFSTDGKFIYVLDPKTSGIANAEQPGSEGGVTVFQITDNERLRWVESNRGKEGCFADARGAAMHPNGKWMYVASAGASCVVACEREPMSGKITVRQIVRDEQDGTTGLNGAMTPVISPDDNFLYVNTGRFSGDNGVTAFSINQNGTLKFLEEHLAEAGAIKNYVGGNGMAVTPDGRNLYAAATRSGTLACFARDPKNGKLTYQETLADDGASGELGGAAGVAVSPDGCFVYVAAEYDNALTVFQRK
jgi:6-phosphogluconolactonase (cycloisomerase 2 family)